MRQRKFLLPFPFKDNIWHLHSLAFTLDFKTQLGPVAKNNNSQLEALVLHFSQIIMVLLIMTLKKSRNITSHILPCLVLSLMAILGLLDTNFRY